MRIKHVLMMVGLTLVMVVLGLSVGREGSSVVEAEGNQTAYCNSFDDYGCTGDGACVNVDQIKKTGPCAFSCEAKFGGWIARSRVACTPKPKPAPGGGGGGMAWGGGGPPAWSDCYYQAVCDANGTMCF